MDLKFRTLYADEIEVRVGQLYDTGKWQGASLLLYKNARVDQDILDETVGATNWQRHHLRDNANCEVGIYDSDKKEWVWKEDTGTESNTEAEKGLASDSFKRACVNWGIGRELYSAPDIVISCEVPKNDKGKLYTKAKFEVEAIEYNARRKITYLRISKYENKQWNFKAFEWGEPKIEKPKQEETPAPTDKPKIDINGEKLDKTISKSSGKQTTKTTDLQAVKTEESAKISLQRQCEDFIKAMVDTKVIAESELPSITAILKNEYGVSKVAFLPDDLAKDFLERLKKWGQEQK